MRIEQEFNCLGYFGFGSGVSVQRSQGPQKIMYCNGCPQASACWQIHRARVAEIFPELAKHIDALGREPDGQAKVAAFVKEHQVEPFSMVMLGNLTDGSYISAGMPPQDRGQYTLTNPLKPLTE